MRGLATFIKGDARKALKRLPDASVHCCVTSPPYWGLRDYGVSGQIGLEPTFTQFIDEMVGVFREVRRVLRPDGTLWLNLGDSYAANFGMGGINPAAAQSIDKRRASGLKPKDLCGIPWRVALALQADGWWLRQDIIWSKPNPMPESVSDRCTKSHEYLFLLSKSARYYFDAEAIKETSTYPDDDRKSRSAITDKRMPTDIIAGIRPGSATYALRNKRSVWEIATSPFPEAHFATFPPALVEPCIKAGTSEKGCCGKCGAPWVRESEKTLVPTAKAAKTFVVDARDYGADANDQGANRQKDGHRPGWINRTETLGWSPTCTCQASVVPCTVLDCFGGAGTTAMVAARRGRRSVSVELNADYIGMSRRRIAADAKKIAASVAKIAVKRIREAARQ